VILVPVIAIVREDEIGGELPLELLEIVFDRVADEREVPVSKTLDRNVAAAGLLQELRRASLGLFLPLRVRAQHHPVAGDVGSSRQEFQDRPAASDLDVIRVRTETQHLKWTRSLRGEIQWKHGRSPRPLGYSVDPAREAAHGRARRRIRRVSGT